MASKVRVTGGRSCVSVIIFNIPEFLHYQGLWLIFDKYDEMVDSFIPNKRSKGGSRFGFVRFNRLEDAKQAIISADRSRIQGNKVRVFMARFQPREAYWRKKCVVAKSAEVKCREENFSLSEVPIVGVVDEDS
ncbi:uncharacterized protein LOC120151700 [Hibiscus syriacus]|uniref:uncharacterized protein LOC120151700 n=1 Tax=Hibiscus syriacus TaxID=106335 RepID=UPI001920CF29|nr:uncharacterized protein LOC120151700 [Hibiscus syriacus]